MQSKQGTSTNPLDGPKSILVNPSRVVNKPDQILEGGEETEIAAQISLPQEGGWGWVVVATSFFSIFILDGVVYTFGSLLPDMVEDLREEESLVTLVNSIASSLYFMGSPVASALINRFGFRACIMTGSVLCSISLCISYFAPNLGTLCLFYGAFAGMGYSLINMASALVVGFYFEKYRAVALGIATSGSSVGIMALSPVNKKLVTLAGWRTTTLFHSGLFAVVFFLGMTFQPLLSFTVMKTAEDPTRTVAYLPSLAAVKHTPSSIGKSEGLTSTVTERLFSAVSNYNFPTAAAVVEEGLASESASQPGTSTGAATSRLTLTANTPHISQRHLKQVKSIISKTSMQNKTKQTIEINVRMEPQKKQSCWGRLCHWEEHAPQSRPMYRDDAFYQGKVENLAEYQKSVMNISADARTGLEYQLAVSRAATAHDLKEKRGLCTTALRRVLATMMDPSLLKKFSFFLISLSSFMNYMGLLVPFVFIQDRNVQGGLTVEETSLFVSAIGLANALGRLTLGPLADKVNPLRLLSFCLCGAGIVSILSTLSSNLYYQYAYCLSFGFLISCVATVRCLVIVSIYGLDKLTNAIGMILLFQGVGSLLGVPLAAVLKKNFGYDVAFCVSGLSMVMAGSLLIPLPKVAKRENAATQPQKNQVAPANLPANPQTQRIQTTPSKTTQLQKNQTVTSASEETQQVFKDISK